MVRFIVPVKFTDHSKSRLSNILSPKQRLSVIERSLNNLVASIQCSSLKPEIHIIIKGNQINLTNVKQHYSDLPLNEALLEISNDHFNEGDRVVILHADLPLFSKTTLTRIESYISKKTSYIFPDKLGQGTNGLIYSHGNFKKFVFGLNSYINFLNLAKTYNLLLNSVEDPDISYDLDDEEDFNNLPQNIINKLID